MVRFSPKIEIINHFDELINQVDIDIEESLKKYIDDQLIGEMLFKERIFKSRFELEMFDSCKLQQEEAIEWSESTKVVDYLNQARMRTIEELRKEQKESVENSSQFNHLKVEITNKKKKEELKSQLFADKFYFQVKTTNQENNLWCFNLFTFVTDFYISQEDINILEKLCDQEHFFITKNPDSKLTFDEKLVVIGLLLEYFRKNIITKQFPNHFIPVSKQDILIIKGIDFKYWNIIGINLTNSSIIDLSRLEYLNVINYTEKFKEIKIEGLSSLKSLKFKINSVKRISLKDLTALRDFELKCFFQSTSQLQNDLIDSFGDNLKSTIETFKLDIGSFEFEFLKHDKSLLITIYKNYENLYFDLIYLLYNYIKKLSIWKSNHDNMIKLLSSHNFPKLEVLDIYSCNISRIESKIFNGSFPMLQGLKVTFNLNLKIIEHDAFSNLKELKHLVMISNSIESINQRTFSELVNLESICLRESRLKNIDRKMLFANLKKLKSIDIV